MTTPTVIKTSKTSDNKTFQVWSDGHVTQALGYYWKGTRKLPTLEVALTVAGEVCLFAAEEVPTLLQVAKKLARKGSFNPGQLRAVASKALEVAS